MLDVQDELLHALPATFVHDWLKGIQFCQASEHAFVIDDFRGVSFEGLSVCV